MINEISEIGKLELASAFDSLHRRRGSQYARGFVTQMIRSLIPSLHSSASEVVPWPHPSLRSRRGRYTIDRPLGDASTQHHLHRGRAR